MNELEQRRMRLIDYLVMKVEQGDWHAVADAAMDLRELEAEMRVRKEYIDWAPNV